MTLTDEQRAEIVRAAKAWLGTPYHHRAAVKGAGADCAMFPVAVYKECGVLPAEYQPPLYSSQWHLHRSDEIYLQEIEKFCRPMRSLQTPLPADFVVVQFGRTFSHGAIVVEWPIVIHSYVHHGVTLCDILRDGEVVGRDYRLYEVALEKIAVWAERL
jgi:cell wall-associated NlpC family hydrolase